MPALVREYNRRMTADFEEVRDFIVLHYAATARDDTPFWQWLQELPLPDTLRERIELFRAQRRACARAWTSCSAPRAGSRCSKAWASSRPCGTRASKTSTTRRSRDSLKTARAAIAGMVAHLPTHEEFLQSVQAG